MKLSLLLFTIFCASSLVAPVRAAPVRKGMDLDLLIHGMARAKYAGGDRTFIDPGDPGGDDDIHYMSWMVDHGTLMATFDAKSRKIRTLYYTLNCEPSIPIGKRFSLRVEWIDCESGQILIQVKKSSVQE